jgi:periplasmic mercuric ion binding protein
MKSLPLTLMAILFIGLPASAQKKVAGKSIIKTPGITCETCKDRVERSLFKMYGITSVKADFKKHITTVTWLTDRTNIEEIKTAIANAGYDADDVTAEEDAYKRLPTGCKKVAEIKPITVAPPVPAPVITPIVLPAIAKVKIDSSKNKPVSGGLKKAPKKQ